MRIEMGHLPERNIADKNQAYAEPRCQRPTNGDA